jgi:hypothetical protein
MILILQKLVVFCVKKFLHILLTKIFLNHNIGPIDNYVIVDNHI